MSPVTCEPLPANETTSNQLIGMEPERSLTSSRRLAVRIGRDPEQPVLWPDASTIDAVGSGAIRFVEHTSPCTVGNATQVSVAAFAFLCMVGAACLGTQGVNGDELHCP